MCLVNGEFYRRTTKDLLLKYLDSVWAEVERFMKESADCGTHQLAPKMKWLLRRDSLLPTRVGREIGSLHGKREFHQIDSVDMMAVKMDFLLKKLESPHQEVNRIMDSRIACETCGDIGYSGNTCSVT